MGSEGISNGDWERSNALDRSEENYVNALIEYLRNPDSIELFQKAKDTAMDRNREMPRGSEGVTAWLQALGLALDKDAWSDLFIEIHHEHKVYKLRRELDVLKGLGPFVGHAVIVFTRPRFNGDADEARGDVADLPRLALGVKCHVYVQPGRDGATVVVIPPTE